jgi:hypothetical protein
VDPQQQRLEGERPVARDHDLAIEHAALGQLGAERRCELREVAVQRLEVAALREHLVAVAEHQRTEAVPLRLEQPAVARGQPRRGLGEHRLDRGLEREAHGRTIPRGATGHPQ